mgnify:CR=1 FL=1
MQINTYQFFLSKPNERGTLKKAVNEDQMITVPFPTNKRFPSFCTVTDPREEGRINVSAQNNTLLEYLRLARWNKANASKYNYTGILFHEHKHNQVAEENFTKAKGTFLLEQEAHTMGLDKARAILRVSDKVNHIKFFTENGGKSEEGIRWEIILLIKNDSELFTNLTQDNKLMAKYDVLSALDMDILTWAGQYGEILSHKMSGEVICVSDQSGDKLEYCANYLMTKGVPTLNGIRRLLGRKEMSVQEKSNKNLNSAMDFLNEGTKEEVVAKIIADHKDKESPKVFDPVNGSDIKFNGIALTDPAGEVKGYGGATQFLTNDANQVTYEAVLAKWMLNNKK